MQPLLSRTNKQSYVLPGGGAPPPPTTAFDEPLCDMHDFLLVLLAHLPPLVKRLGAQPARTTAPGISANSNLSRTQNRVEQPRSIPAPGRGHPQMVFVLKQ